MAFLSFMNVIEIRALWLKKPSIEFSRVVDCAFSSLLRII